MSDANREDAAELFEGVIYALAADDMDALRKRLLEYGTVEKIEEWLRLYYKEHSLARS